MWTFMEVRKICYKYVLLRITEVKNGNQGAICKRYPVMQSSHTEGLGMKSGVCKM